MILIYVLIGIVAFLVVRKAYRRYKVRKVARGIWRDYGQDWDQNFRIADKPHQTLYFRLDYFMRHEAI
jgi:hypothetical protein